MSTQRVYLGTYTDGDSDGIYRSAVDGTTGRLTNVELAAEVENPSFLAVNPRRDHLYAVNELDDGAVTVFEIGPDGELTFLDQRVIGPANPCYCSVDATGNYLLVAHYTGGSVSILPVEDDGLGEPTVYDHEGESVHPERQNAPHPHSVTVGPQNEFVYVPDLGTDEVVVYELDLAAGTLERRDCTFVHEGAGPRHLEFGPGGERGYLINELDSTLTVFERDPSGGLVHVDTVDTVAPDYEGDNFTADVHVHPSGEYVYGSNRGHDSIAVVDCSDGTVRLVDTEPTRGEWPRNFALSPHGEYLFAANAHSDTVSPFAVERETGSLEATGEPVAVPHPVCILPVDE